jgi:hypothetical protein
LDPVKHVYKEEAMSDLNGALPEITAAVKSYMQVPVGVLMQLTIASTHSE